MAKLERASLGIASTRSAALGSIKPFFDHQHSTGAVLTVASTVGETSRTTRSICPPYWSFTQPPKDPRLTILGVDQKVVLEESRTPLAPCQRLLA